MAFGRTVAATIVGACIGLPAQSPALPDEATFFAEVRERLTSNDLLQGQFSYRERSTELSFNPVGRMGTGPLLVYEVYPHPDDDLTYRRLVQRGDRALTANEMAEQDADYRDKLSAWQRRVAREGQSERAARLHTAKVAHEKNAAQLREALDLFTFAIEGRETREGQSTIVISFTPRPDRRARSREGRIARVFAGRAWVHEADKEVMHVEARAIDDVSFGFGMIARLHKGSTASFTRRRIDGTWLPAETHFDGTGRALLFRKVVIHFSRTYSDYRPFDPAELPARLGWEP